MIHKTRRNFFLINFKTVARMQGDPEFIVQTLRVGTSSLK